MNVAALTDVLLYHVVPVDVKPSTVVGLDSTETAQGEIVTISVDNDTVMINDARILITDIEASNGTIHVIDSVFIPTQS